MAILDLTRKVLPKLSATGRESIRHIKNIPEMRLYNAISNGDNSIVHVGMNENAAVRITEKGINTIYTDALNGCNAVGVIAKGLDRKPIAMLSHYTPLPVSLQKQLDTLQKQLQTYDYYIDKSAKPTVFFNIRGHIKPMTKDELVCSENPIIDGVRQILAKIFPKGTQEHIVPYPTYCTPAYYSHANIYQFDKANLNKLKVTTVGEKEHFIDLNY